MSRWGADCPQRLAATVEVLHIHDLPVAKPEYLEQLGGLGTTGLLPPQAYHHASWRLGEDLGADIGEPQLFKPVLEDRPGLVRPVSTRGVAPPEVAACGTTPLESGSEH